MRVSRVSATLVIALLTVACGGSTPTASGTTSSLEDTVVFGGPGGQTQTLFTQCALADFTQKYHVPVKYVAGNGSDLMAKVVVQKSLPTIDVTVATDAEEYIGQKQGVLAQVTTAAIPNLANIPQALRSDMYRVPFAFSLAGIEYNTKIFKDRNFAAPTSWTDLFDPKFKGHVAINSITVNFTQALLVEFAKENGGSATNIDPGFKRMAALKPNLYAIYPSSTGIDQGFQQGTVWIAVNTGTRVHEAIKAGMPVDFVQPNGIIRSTIYLASVKGAPHPKAATALMNWMLSKQVQSCLPTVVGDGPAVPNTAVPQDVARFFTVDKSVRVAITDWPAVEQQLPSWVLRWNKEIESS